MPYKLYSCNTSVAAKCQHLYNSEKMNTPVFFYLTFWFGMHQPHILYMYIFMYVLYRRNGSGTEGGLT